MHEGRNTTSGSKTWLDQLDLKESFYKADRARRGQGLRLHRGGPRRSERLDRHRGQQDQELPGGHAHGVEHRPPRRQDVLGPIEGPGRFADRRSRDRSNSATWHGVSTPAWFAQSTPTTARPVRSSRSSSSTEWCDRWGHTRSAASDPGGTSRVPRPADDPGGLDTGTLKSISSRLGTRSWSSAAATCSRGDDGVGPVLVATCGSVACRTAPGWSTVAPPVWTSPSRCAARGVVIIDAF